MIHGATDYALTRLQARTSGRLNSEGWRQTSSARSLSTALESLRGSGAASWVAGIGSQSEAHAIESRLRARFRAQVDEIRNWADPQWRHALNWCARLVDLPALRQGPEARRVDLRDWPAADRMPFAPGDGDHPTNVEAAWLKELLQRLPALGVDDREELSILQRLVDRHRQRFARLAAGNGWPERELLELQLLTRRRRNPLSPVHLLTAVALALLEYERVRGELLRLAALPADPPS